MNDKKYLYHNVLYYTKCIDDSDTAFLRKKWYPVIDAKPGKLLIRFRSGGANWYSRNRFTH